MRKQFRNRDGMFSLRGEIVPVLAALCCSGLCAAHCILLPALLSLLPFIAHWSVFLSPIMQKGLAATVCLIWLVQQKQLLSQCRGRGHHHQEQKGLADRGKQNEVSPLMAQSRRFCAASGILVLLLSVLLTPATTCGAGRNPVAVTEIDGEYCSLPPAVAETMRTSQQFRPSGQVALTDRLWRVLSPCGGVLLLLSRFTGYGFCRSVRSSDQDKGITSTLTISRCCPPPTNTPVSGGTSL